MIRHCLRPGLLVLFSVSTAAAQTRAPQGNNDSMDRPTEAGFRITPGMARMFAGAWTGRLTAHLGLDQSKADEATEKAARRFMQMVHQMDGPGQELVERFMEEQLSAAARGEHSFVPRGFGKEFGERVVPLVPAIREMARGTVQDIRPMLPLKQQFKLAGEMMAFNKGLDAFEERMRQWASGQADTTRNPFEDENREVKLDELGQSSDLKRAREQAQNTLDKEATALWERYVKDAKAFYGFDESQSATVDSVLRECLERAERLRTDEQWRGKYYRNRVWQRMLFRLPDGWNHPLMSLLAEEQADLIAGFKVIEEDLKTRIDRIPTPSQRRTAEQRIESLLADKGFEMRTTVGTAPEGGAE
ncbi:MAG: hypothetical protein GX616_09925 [Planctomycetes bacterium]|nr:hypothetical protein [Planctomycetota bacterium]